MISSKLFLILAIAACIFAAPSPLLVKVGEVHSGKLYHAFFDQTSACTPALTKDDSEAGVYIGIPQGRLHCNEKVQVIGVNGDKILATVVEATLPPFKDYHILASRGLLQKMGVSDDTETLENVQWSLCDIHNRC